MRGHKLTLMHHARTPSVVGAACEATRVVASFRRVLFLNRCNLYATRSHGHGSRNRSEQPRHLGGRGVGIDGSHGRTCHRLRNLHAHLLLAVLVLHSREFLLLLLLQLLAACAALSHLFNLRIVASCDGSFLLLLLGGEERSHRAHGRADESQRRHRNSRIVLPRDLPVLHLGLERIQCLEDSDEVRRDTRSIPQRVLDFASFLLVLVFLLLLAQLFVLVSDLLLVSLLLLSRNDSRSNQLFEQAYLPLFLLVERLLKVFLLELLRLLKVRPQGRHVLASALCEELVEIFVRLLNVTKLAIVVRSVHEVVSLDAVEFLLILLFREDALQVISLRGSLLVRLVLRDSVHVNLRVEVTLLLEEVQAVLLQLLPILSSLLVEILLLLHCIHFGIERLDLPLFIVHLALLIERFIIVLFGKIFALNLVNLPLQLVLFVAVAALASSPARLA